MRKIALILAFFLLAAPAWADKKIAVQQLRELLASMKQSNKSDEEVATELKKCALSEELTHQAMDSLAEYLPGPLATSQLYVLEADSAVLAPPAADIPADPAPDAAAQKDLLAKAAAYAANTFAQLPTLSATRSLFRFSDDTTAAQSMAGTAMGTVGSDTYVHTATESSLHYVHYTGRTDSPVLTEKGAEKAPAKRDKTRWGENGQIIAFGPGPVLNRVMAEAQAANKMAWLRWETVNGWQTAVFSFAVDKKQSHYAIDYCCFPDVGQTGQAGRQGVTQYGNTGNLQTTVDWIDFKTTAPYHGELFVDAKTGVVVRLVTFADLKPSDLVQKETERIDYTPVKVGDVPMILPTRTIVDTQETPSGDSGSVKHVSRRTLFILEYKDYQPAH